VSGDTVQRLVYMANQIARNLALDATPVASTADHIHAFWSPRMKDQIFSYVEQTGSEGLDPIASQALAALKSKG
jgi:formate dehydrogenase subunit delta